jgi:hypothetical protein
MEERRSEPRRPAGQNLSLQVLGNRRITVPAQLLDCSQGGAGLEVAIYVSPGTLVRLDFENELWLGEVAHCEPRPRGYTLGVRVEQRLSHLVELQAQFQRLDWWQSQGIENKALTQSAVR